MPKRDTPDSPVVDQKGFTPPDPPPPTPGDLPFPGLFRPGPRQIARLKGQPKTPLPPQMYPRNEASFRLDSQVAPQPETSSGTPKGKGKLKIWSLKDTEPGKKTLLPSPEFNERASAASVLVTMAAPTLQKSALPETVQNTNMPTVMASSSITQPAPAEPVGEAQALPFPSLGAPIEFSAPSASISTPRRTPAQKMVMPTSKGPKAALVMPVFQAQASASPLLVAAELLVPSTPLPTPPPEIVQEKLAASSTVSVSASVVPVVQTPALASPDLGTATAISVPSASLPTPPPEMVQGKDAVSPTVNILAPVMPAVQTQASAFPSPGLTTATPIPLAVPSLGITPLMPIPSVLPSLGTATPMPIPSALPSLTTTTATPVPSAPVYLGAASAMPGASHSPHELFLNVPRYRAPAAQQLPPQTYDSMLQNLNSQLTTLVNTDTASWEHLVGCYFQWSVRTPHQVAHTMLNGVPFKNPARGINAWIPDLRKHDEWEKCPNSVDHWPQPTKGSLVAHLASQIVGAGRVAFEEMIRTWAMNDDNINAVGRVMRRAGFMLPGDRWNEVCTISEIKRMPEGSEKKRKFAQLIQESPRFAMDILENELWGRNIVTKRVVDDKGIGRDKQFLVTCTLNSHKEVPWEPLEEPEPPPKKFKMGEGRPTQFHCVPWEERAVDSNGQKLPWSLEWHPEHPNSRGQKRFVDDTGPFGKRVRRRGSRSTTPAKKENPNLDGFEKALQVDQERAAAEAQEKSSTSKSHNHSAATVASSVKVPTQVSLYGFAPGTHWAAVNFYERASYGYICEDYDRDPPLERRRIPNSLAAAQLVRARALTRQEAVLARKFHGGDCWLKVTFDSAEAADLAIRCSPHQIQGHWVYAELFHGAPPDGPDQPIPLQKEDLGRGPYGSAAPAPRASRSLGSSFAKNNTLQARSLTALSNSLPGTSMVQVNSQELGGVTSPSSSTATSATATAPEHSDLRHRVINQPVQNARPPQPDPRFFTHFPDVPRTVLRPAHEAYPPQPSYLETWTTWLSEKGLLPGDMIDDGPPFLENGEFDWASASLYWKIFYWLDSHLWTNFCGLKD